MSYKIEYDESGAVTYSKPERMDYTTDQYCEYVGAASSGYDGVYGKTVIRKNKADKNYKLFSVKRLRKAKLTKFPFG